MKHIPVLLEEVLQSFKDLQIDTFVDGTLGAGGHAMAILKSHSEIKVYIGIDQDREALKLAEKNLSEWKDKLRLVQDNFGNLERILKGEKIDQVKAFLFDIGVSSMQLDEAERGFSFSKDAFLDMRMDQTKDLTAEKVVNTFPEKELEKIFWEYGEERFAGRIAKKIVSERKERRIKTTAELAKIVAEAKGGRGKLHPATLVFQALRIFVNDELSVLKKAIDTAIDHLSTGGRIAVISFHSLEDRIVKDMFKEEAKKNHVNIYRQVFQRPKLELLTKKPITASREEILKNPRSRSAKLRVVEKEIWEENE